MIGYGPVTNSRCLWLYGFALAANPHDAVELYATMSSEISAYERRMELLRALGIESLSTSAPHLLKASQPLPPSLLQSLRVQRAPKKLLKTWLQDPAAFAASVKAPDITLEREILDALRVGVVRMLEAYPTTLEEDEEAEMRWAPHTKTLAAVSAYRYRMALLLRLSEKRILRAAVAKIDAAFNQLNLG